MASIGRRVSLQPLDPNALAPSPAQSAKNADRKGSGNHGGVSGSACSKHELDGAIAGRDVSDNLPLQVGRPNRFGTHHSNSSAGGPRGYINFTYHPTSPLTIVHLCFYVQVQAEASIKGHITCASPRPSDVAFAAAATAAQAEKQAACLAAALHDARTEVRATPTTPHPFPIGA